MRPLLILTLLVACKGEDTDTGDGVPDSPEPYEVVLGDPENCAAYDKVKANSAAEVDGWAVARVDPPYLPAQVEQVIIRFDGRTPCTLTVPGTLRVAVGGDSPPQNPEFLFFGEVTAASEGPATVYTMNMPAMYVDVGERLYIYHQLAGTADAMRCVSVCQDEDKPDEGWFTADAAAPHTYETLGERGLYGSIAVKIVGQAPVEIP